MSWLWYHSALILAAAFAVIVFSFVIRGERARGLVISLSIVAAMLAVADIYFRAGDKPDLLVRTGPPEFEAVDELLGKRLPPPGPYRVSKKIRATGETIFDLVYTIDENGFRKTKGADPSADTVLFFGGSFTFAVGVEDGATYPSQFSNALNNRFHVINLGVGGYGPHQMLRMLDSGVTEAAVKGRVVRAYYFAIDHHIDRVAGIQPWDVDAPRYVLEDDGSLRSEGLYSEDWIVGLAFQLGQRGGLPAAVGRALNRLRIPPQARIALAEAVIQRSAELIKQKFDAELHCLFWAPDWSKDFSELAHRLREKRIVVLSISDFVADLRTPAVAILPGIENHPNAAFHARFGKALAAHYLATQN